MPPEPPPEVTRAMRAFVIAGRWMNGLRVTPEMAFTAGLDAGMEIARRDPAFTAEWHEMMAKAPVLGQRAGARRDRIVEELLTA